MIAPYSVLGLEGQGKRVGTDKLSPSPRVTALDKVFSVALNPLSCRLVLTEKPAFISHYLQPVSLYLLTLNPHSRLKRLLCPRAFLVMFGLTHHGEPLKVQLAYYFHSS